MTKTYTLTEEELEALIKERMEHKPITSQGLFNSVSFDMNLLKPINEKYSSVAEKLDNDTIQYKPEPLKAVFSNVPRINDVTKEVHYSKVYVNDIHNSIRSLVLNVFGKTQNRHLTEDEYEMAQQLYTELKEWYIRSYDKRLETLES
ncbi:hypothetical protein [Streptococcus suis]